MFAGARVSHGGVVAGYPEFLVLRAADGAGRTPDAPAGAVRGRARYQFAVALGELARRRQPVRVELVDGARCDGTIEVVGGDYLEVAEHDLGEARRRVAVRARRFVGFGAVVAVTLPPGRR